jgi:hypothetical protein
VWNPVVGTDVSNTPFCYMKEDGWKIDFILSRVSVTKHGVRIGNWIY